MGPGPQVQIKVLLSKAGKAPSNISLEINPLNPFQFSGGASRV